MLSVYSFSVRFRLTLVFVVVRWNRENFDLKSRNCLSDDNNEIRDIFNAIDRSLKYEIENDCQFAPDFFCWTDSIGSAPSKISVLISI